MNFWLYVRYAEIYFCLVFIAERMHKYVFMNSWYVVHIKNVVLHRFSVQTQISIWVNLNTSKFVFGKI